MEGGAEAAEEVDLAMDTRLPISAAQKIKFQTIPCTLLIFFLNKKQWGKGKKSNLPKTGSWSGTPIF